MIGRKKQASDEPVVVEPANPGKKGKPTPTRREAEAKNRRPLIPADRKAAAKADRDRQRDLRNRQQEGMATGKEEFLAARDKGPVRRFARDIVDARFNLLDWLLPTLLVLFMLTMVGQQNATLYLLVPIAMTAVLLVAVVDSVLLVRTVKKRLRSKFGADVALKGISMYSFMRATQVRPLRLPKPQVKYGQYPQ